MAPGDRTQGLARDRLELSISIGACHSSAHIHPCPRRIGGFIGGFRPCSKAKMHIFQLCVTTGCRTLTPTKAYPSLSVDVQKAPEIGAFCCLLVRRRSRLFMVSWASLAGILAGWIESEKPAQFKVCRDRASRRAPRRRRPLSCRRAERS